jgi:trimeric autotransporter adhesin
MPVPVFTSVAYLSPWLPLPPGWSKVGVDAFVSSPGTSGQVLAGRLRQGATTLEVQVGQTATEVVIVPDSPLATSLDYYVDVQWVPTGTAPGSITWTSYATSPVVTAIVSLVEGSIAGNVLTLAWNFGAAAITPAGANLNAYNSTGQSAGFARVQGLNGGVTLNSKATPGSQIYLQAVMPISGTPGAGFSAPFSMGPILSGAALPLAAPAISSAAFDGGAVQVGWTAPAPPAGTNAGYDLIVTSGGATPASTVFAAGVGGGLAVLGAAQAGATTLSVAGRTRFGRITGAPATAIGLVTQPPLIDQIAVNPDGTSVSARATFPAGMPAGATATLSLVRNGSVAGSGTASASGATATINGLTAAPDGWTVRGQMAATASGAALTGPASPASAVLAAAPAISTMTMSANPDGGGGWIVTLEAGAPPAAGTSLIATLTQNSTTIASQTIVAGTQAHFTLAGAAIDAAKVAYASLATASAGATSPAAQASFVGAAPTVIAVQNIGANDPTGLPPSLQVDSAAGGQTGQVLTIRLTSAGRVVATSAGTTATHASLPLSQPLDPTLAWYVEARWAGAGVTDTTFGGWSAPIAVLTSTTNVTLADYEGGKLALAIQTPQGVAPAQGAYLFAQKTTGGAISGTSVTGTRGSVTVNAASGTWRAGAKPFQQLPASANSRSFAPSSALLAILTAKPSLTALSYDGAILSASWSSVADGAGTAATGAMLQIGDGTGALLTVAAGAGAGEAVVQLPASAQGNVTARVRATLTSNGAQLSGDWSTAIAPLVAAPIPNTVTLDMAAPSVKALLTLPAGVPAGTGYQAWLLAGDRIVAGPVAAVTASGQTSVTFNYAASGVAGLALLAQAQTTVSGAVLTGPRSAPVPVLATAPAFASALITPASGNKWQLDARWTAPADGAAITNYTLALVKAWDGTVIATANAGATEAGSLSFATSAVDDVTAYDLTLSASSANGSVTPLATTPVSFATAAFTSVATGATRVGAQWTGPAGVVYQLRLLDTASGATLATVATGATSGGIDTAALGLQAGGSYALALSIQQGPVLVQPGSDGTAKTRPPLLLGAPTPGLVTLDTAAPSVNAQLTLPAGMPSGTVYQAWLMAGALAVAGPVTAVTAFGKTSVTFNYAAAGIAGLAITAQAQASPDAVALSGPLSAPVPVLATAPAFASGLLAPSSAANKWQLDARWTAPADSAAITNYTLTLVKASDASVIATANAGTAEAASLSFATSAVDDVTQYNLTLTATAANASVTPMATTPLWFATAAFTSAATGDTRVSARWTAPTGPSNVGYQLRLFDGATGAALASVATGATSGGIDTAPLGLQAGGNYLLALGIQQGPILFQPGSDGTAKSRPPLLLGAPVLGTVTLDLQAPSVTATLTPPAGMPAGTGYQGWLMAGDQIVAGPVAAVTASGKTIVTFNYGAAGIGGLTVAAQAQASPDGVSLTGPRSAPVPVLAIAPALVSGLIAPGTANKWQLEARWTPPADGAAITTYTLALVKAADSTVIAQVNAGTADSGSLTFQTSAVDAVTQYNLTLSAGSANGSVTPLAATPFWFATAAFTSVTTGDTRVSAQWTAPTGPTNVGYQLRLLDAASGATLATVATTAASGGIDTAALGLQTGGNYVLALGIEQGPVLFQPGSDGTAKSRPALWLARPAGLNAVTDAADGKAELKWTPVGGASGYTVTFSDGRAPATAGTNSYDFPAALAPGADLKVAVSANIVTDTVVSTGPDSMPLAMPTLAPSLDSANYDGTQVSGSWQPVAGANGYAVSVLSAVGAVAASEDTAATWISFPAGLAAESGPFTIVVQALTEAGSGLPSSPLPVFRTAWFVSTDQPSTAPPNIYPAATLARQPTQIAIYLPPLANTTITVAPVGAFVLTANADAGSKTAFPYILTFAADSEVWTFSADGNPLPAIRPQLQADYVSFLKAAETAGASSWGISALQLAISRWMPQTFEESHYYAYGLSLTGGQGLGSIDLRQGLVLRVGFADYTNVWSGDSNSWLNGFGGGSPTDFDVADSMSVAGAWMLSMDAFVARLTASGAMRVEAPDTLIPAQSAAGVADAADLFFPSFPNPFYRLFFPGTLENPTGTGSVSTTANFALASAATYTAITTSSSTPGPTTPVVFFRGRAVMRIMIRVRVNGMELVVPLGTTVGNLLDRYGVRPPATQVQLTGVTIERAAGPGLAVFGASPPPPSVYDAAQRYMVRLDWATMATYGGPTDATNLPLLHGDRIDF